jgi:hypothetical protein
MPEVSRFFGIVITMHYNDHEPPHFHVRYAEQRAIVSIETLEALEGRLSPRISILVLEWTLAHRSELWRNWHLARSGEPLSRIPPLE